MQLKASPVVSSPGGSDEGGRGEVPRGWWEEQ